MYPGAFLKRYTNSKLLRNQQSVVLFGELTNNCSQCTFRRVHISEVTSQFLNGEFELEPGDGESREDAIRQAGIKTFLVKSVCKLVNR